MRIRIQGTGTILIRIHVDPDPKHCPQDKGADTAKLGLGFMALMGALYIGKKILRK
jgi:hypothetical protein